MSSGFVWASTVDLGGWSGGLGCEGVRVAFTARKGEDQEDIQARWIATILKVGRKSPPGPKPQASLYLPLYQHQCVGDSKPELCVPNRVPGDSVGRTTNWGKKSLEGGKKEKGFHGRGFTF